MNRRKSGLPARVEGPAFPADEVSRLFVEGEVVESRLSVPHVVFPGPRALARRFGVSPSTISRFIRRHGLLEERRRHIDSLRVYERTHNATRGQ